MAEIKKQQLAGMNIHYLYYSLEIFFSCQQKLGITSIELWGGAPHFYMDATTLTDCKKSKKNCWKLWVEPHCIYSGVDHLSL